VGALGTFHHSNDAPVDTPIIFVFFFCFYIFPFFSGKFLGADGQKEKMARGTRWAAHGGMMRPFWKYNMTNKEIRKKEKGEMYYCCVGKRLSKAAAMFFFFPPFRD